MMLGALAQENRLGVFRLLVKRGPEGYAAGDIAERLKVPGPTLSFHLKALSHAGLVDVRRNGRFIYYSARFPQMQSLIDFLTDHCCSLADTGVQSCAPSSQTRARRSA